jgi:hypothetical protein
LESGSSVSIVRGEQNVKGEPAYRLAIWAGVRDFRESSDYAVPTAEGLEEAIIGEDLPLGILVG